MGILYRGLTASLVLAFLVAPPAWAQINVQGWFEDGQTWIVWQDNNSATVNYEIYASETDLAAAGTVVGAAKVGHLIPPDWLGNRLRLDNPTLTFAVPDGSGGTLRLAGTQALFVFTPREERDLYFAVVEEGTTAVGPSNATAAVTQLLEPVTSHLQDLATTDQGQEMRLYAHWILGDDDHTAGRVDYPVLGTADFNGTSHVFAVTDPLDGPPAQDVPAVVAFHGGGGSWWRFTADESGQIGTRLPDGLLISLDGTVNTVSEGPITTAWLGYRMDLDRFAPTLPYPVPDSTLIGAFTTTRVGWTLDWLLDNEPIDENRLAVAGHSAGARGSGMISRFWPERFSAAVGFCPHLEPPPGSPILGDAEQNLETTLGFGVADLFARTNRLSPERDLPFTRLFIGRRDTVGIASWNEQQVNAYHSLDSTGHGYALHWDNRDHGLQSFPGAHWGPSTFHAARALTRYDKRDSYPAFFASDLDTTTTEREDDIGDGDPLVGDTWGTWSGYFDWDPDSIDESADHWTCVLWLTALSSVPEDNFPGTAARTSLALRRPEFLVPNEGDDVSWELELESNGMLLQSGTVTAGQEGLIVVPDLIAFPDPERVRITLNRVASDVGTPPGGHDFKGPRVHIDSVSPNPFRESTEVRWNTPTRSSVKIQVLDAAGRLVRTLIGEGMPDRPVESMASLIWDRRDKSGQLVPAGSYFLRLETPAGVDSRRVVIVD